MDARAFITTLFETGTVLIESPDVPPDAAFEGGRDLFVDLDQHTRLNLAFEAPAPILDVTRWACARLYCACLFLVHRDANAEEVREALLSPCPGGGSPAAAAYSADLLLRYLPGVHAPAGGLSPEDPLVDTLHAGEPDRGRAGRVRVARDRGGRQAEGARRLPGEPQRRVIGRPRGAASAERGVRRVSSMIQPARTDGCARRERLIPPGPCRSDPPPPGTGSSGAPGR